MVRAIDSIVNRIEKVVGVSLQLVSLWARTSSEE
jgi:hypothetical protein